MIGFVALNDRLQLSSVQSVTRLTTRYSACRPIRCEDEMRLTNWAVSDVSDTSHAAAAAAALCNLSCYVLPRFFQALILRCR